MASETSHARMHSRACFFGCAKRSGGDLDASELARGPPSAEPVPVDAFGEELLQWLTAVYGSQAPLSSDERIR